MLFRSQRKIDDLYDHRERQYPIDHAIEECLNPNVGAGAFDFAGLADWAQWFYQIPVTVEEIKLDTLGQTRESLLAIAQRCESENTLRAAVHKGLARYLASADATLTEANAMAVRKWAAEHLRVELTPDELTGPNRDQLESLLEDRFRAARRAVMNDLERYLLLQVHDTSWKDHLYAMDHLKSGVGLRSYAQIDPKVEYKREGLRQFQQMLESIDEKFTDLFFKARWVQREALNRIWSGQSAEHQEMAPGMAQFDRQRQAAIEGSQQSAEKPKPIVRSAARVGRNDPCPCGSGKKYKKCCGG